MDAAVAADDADRDAKPQAARPRDHLRLRPCRAEPGADARTGRHFVRRARPRPRSRERPRRPANRSCSATRRAASRCSRPVSTARQRWRSPMRTRRPRCACCITCTNSSRRCPRSCAPSTTPISKLLAAGATEVIPEIVEGSLMLASHAGAGRCADAQGRAARRGDARRTLQPAARLFPRRGRRGRRRPRAGAATIGAGRCARGRGRAFAGRTGAVCTRPKSRRFAGMVSAASNPIRKPSCARATSSCCAGCRGARARGERLSRHRREPPAAAA